MIKSIYKNSIVDVIFHGERQCFTPKIRNKARYLLSLLLLNIVLEGIVIEGKK